MGGLSRRREHEISNPRFVISELIPYLKIMMLVIFTTVSICKNCS